MDWNTRIWFRKFTRKEVSQLNKKVVIFTFFLFLAFILWYLNSLGKEIKSDFRYPVSFINPPKGRVVSNEIPSKLSLEIKGQGYSLLKRKISGNRIPLVVDFSKVTFKRVPYSRPTIYYVLSAGLMTNFKKQLGNGIEVLSVKPDTIFLTFNVVESVSEKNVK
jgi:hypothetical protein